MKKLLLFTVAVLLITLAGWTQSSTRWTIISDSLNNPTIQYNYTSSELAKLEVYILTLESINQKYKINEVIIKEQQVQLNNYKTEVSNFQIASLLDKETIKNNTVIVGTLTKQINKYEKKAGRWPYWLGGGFIGGLVTCLLLK